MNEQLVSVIVPCRNEQAHIEAFCASVFAQTLPAGWALEVILADGQSDDGTRERLQALAQTDARLVVIDNPGRIVSCGLNRALERARGGLIVRLDVHSVYAPDYIAACIATQGRTGADNVGGPWRAVGQGAWQQAVAAAFQSRWVAGGALSRQLDYEGAVDTVYLGCWPRATFERFGGFDESLVRNQDDEHNLRIVRGGGRVWQSASIRSTYAPRGRLSQLFRQQFQYGYWKPFVMRKHGRAGSLRQAVPGLFVGVVAVLTVLTVLAGLSTLAGTALLAVLFTYALYVAAAAADAARAAGWALWPKIAAVIATWHVGYGLGTWRGWADVWLRGQPSPRFGALTR